MRPSQIEQRSHDYERPGTTTLFAAFIAAATTQAAVTPGEVIGQCKPRHRSSEFCAFLDEIQRNVPAKFDAYVVMEKASSHKTKLIRDWFAKRPRWHMHISLTSSYWLNQVERFFELLIEKKIKLGAHKFEKAPIKDIESFIEPHNTNPKPSPRTESADDILASVERFWRRTLNAHHVGE